MADGETHRKLNANFRWPSFEAYINTVDFINSELNNAYGYIKFKCKGTIRNTCWQTCQSAVP